MADKLRAELGIRDADDFYARLIALHAGLSQEESLRVNAKVILLLANHVGDEGVLGEVLEYVGRGLGDGESVGG